MPFALRPESARPVVNAFLALILVAPLVAGAPSQDSKSAPIAKELAQALDAAKLDGIATADPAAPGTFVAALYIPGSQLLVVCAKYSVPPLLIDKLNQKDYRGLYMDLHSAGVPGSKIFVMDFNADGLASRPEGELGADSYDEGTKSMSFDGDWKKAKISEADYLKAYTDADDRYAKMLSMLLAKTKEVKGKAGSDLIR